MFNVMRLGKSLRQYFKKNSTHPAKIQLRWIDHICDARAYRFYLEIWVNGKLKGQDRIKREAFDSLSLGITASDAPGISFYTLAEQGTKNL